MSTCLKNSRRWDFPGGPVVGTLCFHCKGSRFDRLIWELGSYMSCSQKKKEKQEKAEPQGSKTFIRGQVSTLIKVPTVQTHLSDRYHGKCPQ